MSPSLLERVRALDYSTTPTVAFLVGKPAPGVHVLRDAVDVVAGYGFDGDHPKKSFWRGKVVAGREVTAIALEVLVAMGIGPDVPGDNLVTSGLDLASLKPGDRLVSGTVVLERSDSDHRPCQLFKARAGEEAFETAQAGFRGALFRVLSSGRLEAGTPLEVVRHPRSAASAAES